MTKDQFIFTYLSEVEIYWINWMLCINRCSRHHQYSKDYIKYLQHERYYYMMANIIIETNIGSEGTINNEELCKAIAILKSKE